MLLCHSISSYSWQTAARPNPPNQNSFGHPDRLGRPHHCQSVSAECMAALGQGHSYPLRHHCKALRNTKHKNIIALRALNTKLKLVSENRCNLQVSRYRPARRLTESMRYAGGPVATQCSVSAVSFSAQAQKLPDRPGHAWRSFRNKKARYFSREKSCENSRKLYIS